MFDRSSTIVQDNMIQLRRLFLQCSRYQFRQLHTLRGRMSSARPTHVERTQDASRNDEVSAVTVVEMHELSPTVKGFTMHAESSSLSFKPGQWVDLHVPAVETVGGYSITSSPHQLKEEGTLGLAIQHSQHPPTLWMTTRCCVGDKLSVRVGGDFVYDPTPSSQSHDQSHDLLLIGGGVGINPLFSMLLHHMRLVERKERVGRVKLLYSARSAAELLFKDKLDGLCSKLSWLSVDYFVTQQQPPTTSLPGTSYRRMVQADLATALSSLSPDTLHCYVCGPPPMTDSVRESLAGCGVGEGRLHTEKWW